MKAIVATTKTQKQRKNDFCWVPDGELVTFAMECDGERIDGSCGCRRSMSGVDCLKATTTMQIVELDGMTPDGLAEAVYGHYEKGGWVRLMGEEEAKDYAQADAQELARLADYFPVGTVLEKRGNRFASRVER